MTDRRDGAIDKLRKAARRVLTATFGLWGKGETPEPLQGPLQDLADAEDELTELDNEDDGQSA